MKRKAILLGNTDGLPGVKIDMERFSSFLKSDAGGAWLGSELEIFQDIAKAKLMSKIIDWKRGAFDYVIVLFSGHGGQIRETVLELNKTGEQIEESTLRSIASRQLTIFDCCRSLLQITTESLTMDRTFAAFAKSQSNVRMRYDVRIMEAIPQQVQLYSCSIGEVSYDTQDGGVYLKNLLQAATNQISEFKLVGSAHQEAIEPTLRYSRNEKHGDQNPAAVLPKCLSAQQLIISIKP
ncbi:MAG: caspase family protein [Legionellales bacterium]